VKVVPSHVAQIIFPAQKTEDPITSVKTKAHITNKPNER